MPFKGCGNKCDYVISTIYIQFGQFFSEMYEGLNFNSGNYLFTTDIK